MIRGTWGGDHLDHLAGRADGPEDGEVAACGVLQKGYRGAPKSWVAPRRLHTLHFKPEGSRGRRELAHGVAAWVAGRQGREQTIKRDRPPFEAKQHIQGVDAAIERGRFVRGSGPAKPKQSEYGS